MTEWLIGGCPGIWRSKIDKSLVAKRECEIKKVKIN